MVEADDAKAALGRARASVKGGSSAIARAVGLTPQAVAQWDIVPASRVLGVEKTTGVTRYELRPDIYGERPEAAE